MAQHKHTGVPDHPQRPWPDGKPNGSGQTGSRPGDITFFGYHVVCLIDVLGQKEKLARWQSLPDGGQATPELIDALKQTVGTVLGFRDHFLKFLHQAALCTMPEKLAALPTEKQEQYMRFKNSAVRVERFSDTFLFSALIPNTYGDASVVPVFRVLGACCSAMLLSLAAKTPVRGAVSIGPGATLEDGSFYGPALAEAHCLESEVAGHPRIVVSDIVQMFLTDPGAYSRDPIIANLMREMADVSCSLLCRDTDGQCIVDFAGERARHVLGQDAEVQQAMHRAYEFVRDEAKRFARVGDRKLADRYVRTLEYLTPRLPLWENGSARDPADDSRGERDDEGAA